MPTLTLSDVESQLVDTAIAERNRAIREADAVMGQRLSVIRTARDIPTEAKTDYKQTKDGKWTLTIVQDTPVPSNGGAVIPPHVRGKKGKR